MDKVHLLQGFKTAMSKYATCKLASKRIPHTQSTDLGRIKR